MSESAATPIDPAAMKAGKQQFMLCTPCHGPTGLGTPGVAPPLAGSEWVNGPPENLIRIQLRGLHGPIKVKGKTYEFPGGMPPQFFQTDEQIANVLTFVRNSWGNKAPAVTPDQVAALRSEVGKPQLTMAELVPPGKETKKNEKPASKDAAPAPETAKTEEKSGTNAADGTPAAETAAKSESGAATAPGTTEVPVAPAPPAASGDSAPAPLAFPFWVWLLALAWLALCLLPILRRK